MPSKTKGFPADQYPHLQLEELTALSNEVCECVAEEQWEQLAVVLDLRQRCLEKLFSDTVVEPEVLRSLAGSIIEQDAVFIEKIQERKKALEEQTQEQKNILEEQILAFDKGRQAVQAYSSI